MTGVTAATPLDHGEFHDEFSFTVTDFCEVSGLTVQIHGVVDGTFLAKPQGHDARIHFMDHLHVTRVLTNVGSGASVSDDERTVVKDLRVVDNGDGTLTITVLATGNFVVYDADGKAIARNPGQSASPVHRRARRHASRPERRRGTRGPRSRQGLDRSQR